MNYSLQELYPDSKDSWDRHLIDSPQQSNGSDCGVHLILNAYCYLGCKPIEYPHEAVRYMRYRLVNTIVHGHLLRV